MKFFSLKKRYFLSLFSLLVVVISCSKDKDYIKMSAEFKRYVNFPKGSWWVYDTIGGYDTVTVFQNVPVYKVFHEAFDRYEDIGRTDVVINGDSLILYAEVLNNGGETIENLRYIVRQDVNNVLGSSLLFRYGNRGWEKLDNEILEKLDSFDNGFHKFGQTIKSIPESPNYTLHNHRDSLEYLFKELHWTENIGLTRFITTKGTTYNLVNYEIK